MSVTITLDKLKAAERGLGKLMNSDLPVKMSYTLSKGLKGVRDELKQVEEKRVELIKKYGVTDGEGNISIEQGSETETIFKKEYTELLETEVELWFTPIKLSEIPSSISISPVEIEFLAGTFIIDDLEESVNAPSANGPHLVK